MRVDLGEAYRDAFRRIDARVRALAADGRSPAGIPVPACPGWSVHGVVSHLAGIAVDATQGRLSEIPDDAWTAGQVAERADRTTGEVLDEWAGRVDALAAVVTKTNDIPPAADALTHEGDILEALGEPVPPEDGWRPTARLLCGLRIKNVSRPGSLTVATTSDTWRGGSGGDGPVAAVEVEPWELFRAVMSRRSREQMRSWPWDGDPDGWLEPLTVFGVRDDDQPRCAAPG